jgi:hypothetical protein
MGFLYFDVPEGVEIAGLQTPDLIIRDLFMPGVCRLCNICSEEVAAIAAK